MAEREKLRVGRELADTLHVADLKRKRAEAAREISEIDTTAASIKSSIDIEIASIWAHSLGYFVLVMQCFCKTMVGL